MNLISIDLEMNQPTGEIISIGYVIFNVKSKEVLRSNNIIVYTSNTINPNIVTLCGITDIMIQYEGLTLHEAYGIMIKDIEHWQVNKHPVQWGLDHYELRNQLGLTWDDYVFRPRGHDIKSLYQLYRMSLPQGKIVSGLGRSMKALGMDWDYTYGNQHNSLADAYNTMLVLFKLQDKFRRYETVERTVCGK